MQFSYLSRLLIILGGLLVLAGILIWAAGKIPWLKNLTGTLRFEVGGLTCIFPILASIGISLVLTIVLNILGRIIGR